ncbi:hypothetical protein F5050DRAFT_1906056, partial [Lentinula boryana]
MSLMGNGKAGLIPPNIDVRSASIPNILYRCTKQESRRLVCLRQLLEAFIWGPPGNASLYFATIQDRLSITKLALYELNKHLAYVFMATDAWLSFFQLWSAGRPLEELGIRRSKHPYIGIILTIVESGGIFATATLIT